LTKTKKGTCCDPCPTSPAGKMQAATASVVDFKALPFKEQATKSNPTRVLHFPPQAIVLSYSSLYSSPALASRSFKVTAISQSPPRYCLSPLSFNINKPCSPSKSCTFNTYTHPILHRYHVGLVRRRRHGKEGCTQEGDFAAPGTARDALQEREAFAKPDGRARQSSTEIREFQQER
jgi:hypothetical protein